MNTQNPIMNELENLAPTLINVPRTLPYSVQNGYFDNFPATVLGRLGKQDSILTDSFSIGSIGRITPFSIPKDYFLNLADNIFSKIKSNENEVVISPFIENPYQVPDGYFNNLPGQIIEKTCLLEKSGINGGNIFSADFVKTTPYQVPGDYFNSLSANVLSRLKGNEPESETDNDPSETLHFTKVNPYKIPAGYFNDLAIDILNKLTEAEDLTISNSFFTKSNPYNVPTGYFEGLSGEILGRLNAAKQDVPEGYFTSLPDIILQKVRTIEVETELEEIAPLLNTINKKPVNTVPIGYFDALAPALPQVAQPAAKVIGIRKKTNWFKSAIAACLIGTLGFSAYQIMDNNSNAETVKTIQELSPEEVPVSVPTADINIDEELSKVDDASLVKYMNNIEMPTEQATAHFQDVNSGDVDEALQDISDEALQQHLDETGELPNKKN